MVKRNYPTREEFKKLNVNSPFKVFVGMTIPLAIGLTMSSCTQDVVLQGALQQSSVENEQITLDYIKDKAKEFHLKLDSKNISIKIPIQYKTYFDKEVVKEDFSFTTDLYNKEHKIGIEYVAEKDPDFDHLRLMRGFNKVVKRMKTQLSSNEETKYIKIIANPRDFEEFLEWLDVNEIIVK